MNTSNEWAPEYAFEPKDDLSKQLLTSIPKKVHAWLENLNQATNAHGGFNLLQWMFSNDGDICGGSIVIYDDVDDLDNYFQISWNGPVNAISNIFANDSRFSDLVTDLTFFTSVEKKIYDQMESFQQSLDNRPKIDNQKVAKLISDLRHSE